MDVRGYGEMAMDRRRWRKIVVGDQRSRWAIAPKEDKKKICFLKWKQLFGLRYCWIIGIKIIVTARYFQ